MAIPSLSTEPYPSNFVETRSANKVVDQELGGVGFQDPSKGLLYQVWTCRTDGASVTIEAPNTPAFEIYSGSEITEISIAFDSNMNYALAFVEGGVAKFKWYDSTISDFTITNLGAEVTNPRCAMDDKRAFNNSGRDVILAYLKSGALTARVQRDRYDTEYPLDAGPWDELINIGMNRGLRFQYWVK